MRWEKLGRVFVADDHQDWMRTHAAWPRAIHLRDDIFRVFFSTRDEASRSHIGFVDIDLEKPTDVLRISAKPVLSPGPPGAFDESGVLPSDVVRLGDRLALFYGGISVTAGRGYDCFCGLAYLNHDRTIATRASADPLLGRSPSEPGSAGMVCVRRDPVRPLFHMWYESAVATSPSAGGQPGPGFVIKHALSYDGLNWDRPDEVSIGEPDQRPYVSNPSVVIDEGVFRMWYSYKTADRYRIGYAESPDGTAWVREDDEAGISPSQSGWDSEDVEYPSVFRHGRDLYMLYNGNRYGQTGFGLARLARD